MRPASTPQCETDATRNAEIEVEVEMFNSPSTPTSRNAPRDSATMDGLIDSSAASPAEPTRPDVVELRRLLDAATEGPWTVKVTGGRDFTGEGWSEVVVEFEGGDDFGGQKPGLMLGDHEEAEDDAALIAALRNAAPWLLAQAAAVARVEALCAWFEDRANFGREMGVQSAVDAWQAAAFATRAALAGPGVSE